MSIFQEPLDNCQRPSLSGRRHVAALPVALGTVQEKDRPVTSTGLTQY